MSTQTVRVRGAGALAISLIVSLAACTAGGDDPVGPKHAPSLGKSDGWAAVHSLEHVRTFSLSGQDYTLLHGDDPDGTRIIVDPSAPVFAWQWTGNTWTYAGYIDEPTTLTVQSPAWLAVYPVEDADVQTAYVGRAQLRVERMFGGAVDGLTSAPAGAVPGRRLYALVTGEGLAQSESVAVTLSYPAESAVELVLPQPVEARFVALEQLEIAGDQRVIELVVPDNARVGYATVEVSVAGLVAASVPVDISTAATVAERQELATFAEAYIAELSPEQPLSIVAGYNPLPEGSMVSDGMTGEVIHRVTGEREYLFFGFDPESLFEQPEARWLLADAATGELRVLEGQGGWPVVELETERDSDSEEQQNEILVDFGGHGVLYNQFFNASAGGVLLSTTSLYPPRSIQYGTQVNKGKQITGNAAGCATYRKVGIIVRLDDNTKPTMRTEKGKRKAIPSFDEVVKQEFQLLQGLGFDDIYYVKPADLVSIAANGTQSLKLGALAFGSNKYGTKGLKPIFDRISQAIDSIKNCCGEIAIFVNAHQTKSGFLVFSHHYTNKKLKRVRVRKPINAGAFAQAVAKLFADKKQTCIPTALMFHSCYSGKFDGSEYSSTDSGAINVHKKLVVISSSAHNQKSRGTRALDRVETFFFLEALDECLLIRDASKKIIGVKTLKDAWKCIQDKTKEKATKAGFPQSPKRKQHSSLD